jgi:4a-hydroxytetrahydrobiopterin dehydratase
MKMLDEAGLREAAGRLPKWSVDSQGLQREVKLEDFKASLALVNRIGAMAEEEGHHPDIEIRYNRVKLTLVTHDAGGVTAKDVEMAEKLNALL